MGKEEKKSKAQTSPLRQIKEVTVAEGSIFRKAYSSAN